MKARVKFSEARQRINNCGSVTREMITRRPSAMSFELISRKPFYDNKRIKRLLYRIVRTR